MKGNLVKTIKNEFGLRKVNGKKLELYNFYELCGFYKKLRSGGSLK